MAAVGRRATWWQPALVLVALIGVGYLIAGVFALQGRGFLWPYPHEVLYAALLEPTAVSQIYPALLNSALVALTGLAIAVVVGVAAATIMVQARWIERSFFPYAVILQCLPILAARAADRHDLRLQLRRQGRRDGHDLAVPDDLEHPVRPAGRGQGPAGALPAAVRRPRDDAREAAVPGGDAVDLRGAANGRRALRDRRDRRRPAVGQGSPGLGTAIQVFTSRTQGAEAFAAILIASLFGIAVFLIFGLLGRLAVGKWFDLG